MNIPPGDDFNKFIYIIFPFVEDDMKAVISVGNL